MNQPRPIRSSRAARSTVVVATHPDRALALAQAFADRGCAPLLAFSREQVAVFAADAGIVVTDATIDPDALVVGGMTNPSTVRIFVGERGNDSAGELDEIFAPELPASYVAARALDLIGPAGHTSVDGTPLVWGDLELDTSRRESRWRERPLALTPTQFDILAALVQARGGVVPKEQLRLELWPHVERTSSAERLLAHVRRIRNLVEIDHSRPEFLLTVRGVGFRLADPHARATSNEPSDAVMRVEESKSGGSTRE